MRFRNVQLVRQQNHQQQSYSAQHRQSDGKDHVSWFTGFNMMHPTVEQSANSSQHSRTSRTNSSATIPVSLSHNDYSSSQQAFQRLNELLQQHIQSPALTIKTVAQLHLVQGAESLPADFEGTASMSELNEQIFGASISDLNAEINTKSSAASDHDSFAYTNRDLQDPWAVYKALSLDMDAFKMVPRATFTLLLRYTAQTMLTPGMCLDHISSIVRDMAMLGLMPTNIEWRLIVLAYCRSGAISAEQTIVDQSQGWTKLFERSLGLKLSTQLSSGLYDVDLKRNQPLTPSPVPNGVFGLSVFYYYLAHEFRIANRTKGLESIAQILQSQLPLPDESPTLYFTHKLQMHSILGNTSECLATINEIFQAGHQPTVHNFDVALHAIVTDFHQRRRKLQASYASQQAIATVVPLMSSSNHATAAKPLTGEHMDSAWALYSLMPPLTRTRYTHSLMISLISDISCTREHLIQLWKNIQASDQVRPTALVTMRLIYALMHFGDERTAAHIFSRMMTWKDIVPDPRDPLLHNRYVHMCLTRRKFVLAKVHLQLMMIYGVEVHEDVCIFALRSLDGCEIAQRLREEAESRGILLDEETRRILDLRSGIVRRTTTS